MTVNGVMFMEPTVVSNNIVVYKLNKYWLFLQEFLWHFI